MVTFVLDLSSAVFFIFVWINRITYHHIFKDMKILQHMLTMNQFTRQDLKILTGTYIHTHIHTCIHTYIHTYIHK